LAEFYKLGLILMYALYIILTGKQSSTAALRSDIMTGSELALKLRLSPSNIRFILVPMDVLWQAPR